MLERLHSFITSLRTRSASRGRITISVQETGFQRLQFDQRPEAAQSFQWQEVTTVMAYKRQCFSR
jgi:hypothetical protein